MDAIKNGYDTQGWNFNDTEGRNLITNMNNRIVQGMFFDNVFAVEEGYQSWFKHWWKQSRPWSI